MRERVKCESCDKLIPREDATWWVTPIVCCWLCEDCVAIQPVRTGDAYADHFVALWEHEFDMKQIASDFDEPYRSTLLHALEELSSVIQSVNVATDAPEPSLQ